MLLKTHGGHKTHRDSLVDVFLLQSLGCTLHAMCFYESPFDTVYQRGDSVALAVISGVVHIPDSTLSVSRLSLQFCFLIIHVSHCCLCCFHYVFILFLHMLFYLIVMTLIMIVMAPVLLSRSEIYSFKLIFITGRQHSSIALLCKP